MQHVQENKVDSWKTLDTFTESYPEFSHNQVLWLARNRKYNGLNHIIRKVGKRLYIHDEMFAAWLANHG